MGKIYSGQNWRLICDTEEDQATATALKIFAKSPSGVTDEFNAVLDANVNRVYYDVKTTDMTETGDWSVWPKTTIGANVAPGEPALIHIYQEGGLVN